MKLEFAIKRAKFILSALREAAKNNSEILEKIEFAEDNIVHNILLAYNEGFYDSTIEED